MTSLSRTRALRLKSEGERGKWVASEAKESLSQVPRRRPTETATTPYYAKYKYSPQGVLPRNTAGAAGERHFVDVTLIGFRDLQ